VAADVRYARNGDVAIAYQVVGDGPFDVVCVPGFVSHMELLWEEPAARRVFDRLSGFARLILHDKREQGLSDRLGRAPTLEESTQDLFTVMDAAASPRAALFGLSEGAPLSLLAAATHPDRVTALAVYGGYARMLAAPDYPSGVSDAWLTEAHDRLVEAWGGPALLERFAPSMAGDARFGAWWSRLLRYGTSPRGVRALLEWLARSREPARAAASALLGGAA
jgi:pimeloyl-ACP methyl ester carboxylesterase